MRVLMGVNASHVVQICPSIVLQGGAGDTLLSKSRPSFQPKLAQIKRPLAGQLQAIKAVDFRANADAMVEDTI